MIKMEYEFYNKGFFGFGESGNFKYFSLAHFLPIILLIIGCVLIYKYRDKIRNSKHEENIRFIIAFFIMLAEMSYFWRLVYVGSGSDYSGTLMDKLPLQLCQWSAIFSAFMIMKKSKFLYTMCYFVCLTFGVLPLITPAVIDSTGPAYYRYYQFWLEHLLPIIAVVYMTFVHGFRVKLKNIWMPYLYLTPLLVLSIIANVTINKPTINYLYLATGTDGDSLANILPQSIPIRVLIMGVASICLFLLVYLPVYFEKRHQDKLNKAS